SSEPPKPDAGQAAVLVPDSGDRFLCALPVLLGSALGHHARPAAVQHSDRVLPEPPDLGALRRRAQLELLSEGAVELGDRRRVGDAALACDRLACGLRARALPLPGEVLRPLPYALDDDLPADRPSRRV